MFICFSAHTKLQSYLKVIIEKVLYVRTHTHAQKKLKKLCVCYSIMDHVRHFDIQNYLHISAVFGFELVISTTGVD